jgi:hypothetical protein
MLPGDVYQGNVSMYGDHGKTNPAIIGRATDLAGLIMSGTGFAPRGALCAGPSGPVEKRNPELAMDKASRTGSAKGKSMGFRDNMPLYHGSGQSFDEFKAVPTDARNLQSPGVFAALDPQIANEFAVSRGNERTNPQVYKLLHRADSRGVLKLDGGEPHHEVVATLRHAFDRGHDAVLLKNYTSPGGKTGDIIIVRDANQLRSVNAAFDPAKRNSGNLLAGIAAAAPASIAGHAAGDRGSDTGNEKEFLSLVQNGRAL